MRIETNQDLETAIARLASRAPETLATFIASLAFDAGPIGEQVRTFIVGDNLSETSAPLKERIDALRGSRRANSRHRAHEEVGEGSITFCVRLRRWTAAQPGNGVRAPRAAYKAGRRCDGTMWR